MGFCILGRMRIQLILNEMKTMITKEIVDRKGKRFEWTECNDHGWFKSIVDTFFPTGIETVMSQIKTLELREDDVLICTFPKAGK